MTALMVFILIAISLLGVAMLVLSFVSDKLTKRVDYVETLLVIHMVGEQRAEEIAKRELEKTWRKDLKVEQ